MFFFIFSDIIPLKKYKNKTAATQSKQLYAPFLGLWPTSCETPVEPFLMRTCECIWRCVGKVLDGRRCGSSSSSSLPLPPLLHHLLLLLLLQISSLFKASHAVSSHQRTLRSEDISPRFHSLWCLFYFHFDRVFLWLTHSVVASTSVNIWSYLAPWSQIIRKFPFFIVDVAVIVHVSFICFCWLI